MSSFSSLSSIGPSPSCSAHQTRTDGSRDSCPSTPRIRTSTSQALRHPRPPSSPVARFLVWDQQENLPSSSKLPVFPPRTPIGDKQGHASRRLSLQTPPSYSKVRSRTSADASHNEVSPGLRVGGLGRALRFETHQSEHAPTERTTRLSSLVRTRVSARSLNEAPSLSSSLASAPSFAAPHTPQSQVSLVRLRGYQRHPFVTPSASSSSLRNDIPCVRAQCEPLTPSPSPRSHASRRSQPRTRSSPLVPPQTFTFRRGLVLPRARPTLAMSLQVHAPTPVMSPKPMSPALPSTARPRSRSRPPPSSRPSSPLTSSVPLPQRPPMPRPPSRSERLLRDTLRRAEEQDRIGKPHPAPSFTLAPSSPGSHIPPSVTDMFATCRVPAVPSGGRRHRRNTSSSVQSESSCDYFEGEPLDEDSQEDEEDSGWLWRANTVGSVAPSGHGYGHTHYPAPARKAENVSYGTPASPSPARAQLQRAATSSPTVPRRHSHSQSVSHVAAHPPSRTSIDGERPGRSRQQPNAPLTPHEAVLRSKLEGMLKNTSKGGPRTRNIERRDADPEFSSESSNSMASSRNLSGEGDFFFGASSDPSLTSLSSTESKSRASPSSSPRKPHTNLQASAPLPRPTRKSSSPPSQNGRAGPLTPPPSPPFNAHHAATHIKGMDGYVSFANIEGLGVPDGTDDEAENASRSRWFQWLHLNSGKGAVACDRSRGRSESTGSTFR